MLWDEEEAELDNKSDGDIPTNVSAEEGEVEELDYDESMEDLDLHPTGNIDEEVGALSSKLTVKLDVEKPGLRHILQHVNDDTYNVTFCQLL